MIAEVKKMAQSLTFDELWGASSWGSHARYEALTPEEGALNEVWLERLRDLDAAYEARRASDIQVRQALEAVHLAAHNFEALRAVLDAARESKDVEAPA